MLALLFAQTLAVSVYIRSRESIDDDLLKTYKSNGIEGIVIPLYWTKIELKPKEYDFENIRKLIIKIKEANLKVIPEFDFRLHGGEFQEFVVVENPFDGNDQSIIVKSKKISGRYPSQIYEDFMKQFAKEFAEEIKEEIIAEIELAPHREIMNIMISARNTFKDTKISSMYFEAKDLIDMHIQEKIAISIKLNNIERAKQHIQAIQLPFNGIVKSENLKEALELAKYGLMRITIVNRPTFDSDFTTFIKSVSRPIVRRRVSSSAADFNSIIMFQVMVSSFQSGDSNLGYGTGYGPSSHKGDLIGIMNALDYIKGLGVNALWMTPVFDSTNGQGGAELQSTGYFCTDYFNIDPKFGGNDRFKQLVDRAHEKGLYIILDGVFGHHGGNIKGSPSGKYPQGGSNPVSYPGSLDFYKEVATYWINKYEIDGWRLDQCYQLNQNGHNYMKEIREAVESTCQNRRNEGKQWGTLGYIVGEDWEGSYEIQQHTYSGAGLRSAFDFPSRYLLIQSLASEESGKGGYDVSNMVNIFKAPNEKGYYHEKGEVYPNLFVTNHDVWRFGNLIKQKYGYDRNHNDYWKRYKLAISCLAAYTGPITLYYGDELGDMIDCWPNCGSWKIGGDNMARSDGRISGFNSREQGMHDYVRTLMNIRTQHPACWRGNNHCYKKDNCLVNIKYDAATGDKIVFILNPQTYGCTVYVDGISSLKNLENGKTSGNSIYMDPLTSGIFQAN